MVTTILNAIAFILMVIGGLNWGLVGIFDWNLVSAIFGAGQTFGSILIYCLVLFATLYLIVMAIYQKGKIILCDKQNNIQ